MSLDFIMDLPQSKGHTCILVVIDLFTKMVDFIPCLILPMALETARLYLQEVFFLHSLPEHLVSDQGVQFTSRFWQALHAGLDTCVHLSWAHHPQTDGQTDQCHSEVVPVLPYKLPAGLVALQFLLTEFAYSNAVHVSTQQTPFMVTYMVLPVSTTNHQHFHCRSCPPGSAS